MTPWMQHLAQHLVGERVVAPNRLRFDVPTVIAETQRGLAWHEGEALVGAVHFEFPSRGRALGAHLGFLVTDRRLVGRVAAMETSLAVQTTEVDIPYGWLTGVEHDKGLVTDAVIAWSGNRRQRVPMLGETLHRVLYAAMQAPPTQRTGAGLDLSPSEADPTGAMRAASQMRSGDARTHLVARLVHAQHGAGALTVERAQNVLLRAMILDRTMELGRGMHEGQWLSVLPRGVLRAALDGALGAPVARMGDAHWETTDHTLHGSSGTGRAVASTALGLAALAVVGVGWVSLPGAPGLVGARLTLVDFPCGSGFILHGSTGGAYGPLPLSGAPMFRAVSESLVGLEARFLLLHTLWPEAPADASLFSADPQSVAAAVTARVGPADLHAFLRA